VLLRGESNLRFERSTARRLTKQLVLRAVFGRVDHFLSIGTLNTQYYRHYGVAEQRITMAPYSVDNAYFARGSLDARADQAAVRRRLGIPEEGVVFVSSGKLIERKRPLDILRAFADSGAADAALVYVGDGPLRPRVEQAADELGLQDRVVFLGFRNQSELPEIYGAGDVLVLASALETWGLVVNEGMAAGLVPVVSDQVGSAPDLVDDGRTFPTGDIDALGALMRRLATDPSALDRARDDAAERISRWGLDETTDGVLLGAERAMAGATT
jgi:glycosyltransferase involved in cell wall biosynthesis